MLHRCGLLSYGSPVSTLYGQVFPAYFGQGPVEDLRGSLAEGAGGWINLHRLTDEIGGAVIGAGDPTLDQQLPDPAEIPPSQFPLEPGDPELLRPVWADVAGHGQYRHEVAYKRSVRELRAGLG